MMIAEIELTDEQIKHISGGVHSQHWGHSWGYGYGFGSPWGYAAPYGYGYGYPQVAMPVAEPQVALVPVATTVVQQGYQVASLVAAGC